MRRACTTEYFRIQLNTIRITYTQTARNHAYEPLCMYINALLDSNFFSASKQILKRLQKMAQVPSPTGAIILLSLFAGLSRAQPSCVNQDAEVLILGAGMSGIAAARTLYDRGLKDFLILEGRSGIGGRMRGADFAGVKIELGANWIMEWTPIILGITRQTRC